MLDGRRYYAAFPDENPANRKPILRHSPALMAALRALEKELRPLFRQRRLKTKASGQFAERWQRGRPNLFLGRWAFRPFEAEFTGRLWGIRLAGQSLGLARRGRKASAKRRSRFRLPQTTRGYWALSFKSCGAGR